MMDVMVVTRRRDGAVMKRSRGVGTEGGIG